MSDRHLDYLRQLQERNRLKKLMQEKSQEEAHQEELERGFQIHFNGPHSMKDSSVSGGGSNNSSTSHNSSKPVGIRPSVKIHRNSRIPAIDLSKRLEESQLQRRRDASIPMDMDRDHSIESHDSGSDKMSSQGGNPNNPSSTTTTSAATTTATTSLPMWLRSPSSQEAISSSNQSAVYQLNMKYRNERDNNSGSSSRSSSREERGGNDRVSHREEEGERGYEDDFEEAAPIPDVHALSKEQKLALLQLLQASLQSDAEPELATTTVLILPNNNEQPSQSPSTQADQMVEEPERIEEKRDDQNRLRSSPNDTAVDSIQSNSKSPVETIVASQKLISNEPLAPRIRLKVYPSSSSEAALGKPKAKCCLRGVRLRYYFPPSLSGSATNDVHPYVSSDSLRKPGVRFVDLLPVYTLLLGQQGLANQSNGRGPAANDATRLLLGIGPPPTGSTSSNILGGRGGSRGWQVGVAAYSFLDLSLEPLTPSSTEDALMEDPTSLGSDEREASYPLEARELVVRLLNGSVQEKISVSQINLQNIKLLLWNDYAIASESSSLDDEDNSSPAREVDIYNDGRLLFSGEFPSLTKSPNTSRSDPPYNSSSVATIWPGNRYAGQGLNSEVVLRTRFKGAVVTVRGDEEVAPSLVVEPFVEIKRIEPSDMKSKEPQQNSRSTNEQERKEFKIDAMEATDKSKVSNNDARPLWLSSQNLRKVREEEEEEGIDASKPKYLRRTGEEQDESSARQTPSAMRRSRPDSLLHDHTSRDISKRKEDGDMAPSGSSGKLDLTMKTGGDSAVEGRLVEVGTKNARGPRAVLLSRTDTVNRRVASANTATLVGSGSVPSISAYMPSRGRMSTGGDDEVTMRRSLEAVAYAEHHNLNRLPSPKQRSIIPVQEAENECYNEEDENEDNDALEEVEKPVSNTDSVRVSNVDDHNDDMKSLEDRTPTTQTSANESTGTSSYLPSSGQSRASRIRGASEKVEHALADLRDLLSAMPRAQKVSSTAVTNRVVATSAKLDEEVEDNSNVIPIAPRHRSYGKVSQPSQETSGTAASKHVVPSSLSSAASSSNSVSGKAAALPRGKKLYLDILSTWGDACYLGLTGIEIYGDDFSLLSVPTKIRSIEGYPAGLGCLPGYDNDPRVITNLIDGVNDTKDDLHAWLAPQTQVLTSSSAPLDPDSGRSRTLPPSWWFDHRPKPTGHLVDDSDEGRIGGLFIEFSEEVSLSAIRIFNFNKSRTHNQRGVREVVLFLDNNCLYKGEIKKASGRTAGPASSTSLHSPDAHVLAFIADLSPLYQKWENAASSSAVESASSNVPSQEEVLEDSLASLPRPSTAIGQPDVIPINNESSPPHGKSSQGIATFNQLEREANGEETRSLNVEDWLRSSMSSGTLLPPFEVASQLLVQEKEKDITNRSSLLQSDPIVPSSSAVLQISPSTSVDDVLREMAELGVLVSPTPSAPRISESSRLKSEVSSQQLGSVIRRVATSSVEIIYAKASLSVVLIDNYGDPNYLGLTGIELLVAREEKEGATSLCGLPVDFSRLTLSLPTGSSHSQDNDPTQCGSPAMLARLIQGNNITIVEDSMWRCPLSGPSLSKLSRKRSMQSDHLMNYKSHYPVLTFRFDSSAIKTSGGALPLCGIRLWNYNSPRNEGLLRGVRNAFLVVDDEQFFLLPQLNPGTGFDFLPYDDCILWKDVVPFSPKQELSIAQGDAAHPSNTARLMAQHQLRQTYEVPLLAREGKYAMRGKRFTFHFYSNHGDSYYLGLDHMHCLIRTGASSYEALSLGSIHARRGRIAAFPHSVSLLGGSQANDPRVPEQLLVPPSTVGGGLPSCWLAPLASTLSPAERSAHQRYACQVSGCAVVENTLPPGSRGSSMDRNLLMLSFPHAIDLAVVSFVNYSRTPARGVASFAIEVDGLLVFRGDLKSAAEIPGPQSVLFTVDPNIIKKYRDSAVDCGVVEQDVLCINERQVMVRSKTMYDRDPAERDTSLPRPSTSYVR